MRSLVYSYLGRAERFEKDKQTGETRTTPFQPNPSDVSSVIDAIAAEVHLAGDFVPPNWVDGGPGDLELMWLRDVLPMRNGLLNLVTGKLRPHTPRLFCTYAADFDYDPQAREPGRWLEFLYDIWPKNPEKIACLQQWFGYCLTADTSMQKMLLLVGPRRSGKGTIARVLTCLLGRENVAGPTASSLASHFGLQGLIGKPLAIVSDARFAGSGVSMLVERLLCISGEDRISIPRKNLEDFDTTLPTRMMFLSNEMPRLPDAGGAIASRFVVLTMDRSFYGQEDPCLTEKLLEELPGILLWSIKGYRSLYGNGYFEEPNSSAVARQEMENIGSPVKSFVEECCTLGDDESCRCRSAELYDAYRLWAGDQGQHPDSQPVFGRNFASAFPNVAKRRDADGKYFHDGLKLSPSWVHRVSAYRATAGGGQ